MANCLPARNAMVNRMVQRSMRNMAYAANVMGLPMMCSDSISVLQQTLYMIIILK